MKDHHRAASILQPGGGSRFTAQRFAEMMRIFESRPRPKVVALYRSRTPVQRHQVAPVADLSPASRPGPHAAQRDVAVPAQPDSACRPVVVRRRPRTRRARRVRGESRQLLARPNNRSRPVSTPPYPVPTVTPSAFVPRRGRRRQQTLRRRSCWRGTKKVAAVRITFGAYVSRSYAALDLAASTMQNYRRQLRSTCYLPSKGRRSRTYGT